MSIEVKPITRRFLYNGITLPDVPGLDPKAVRDLYAAQYPELLSAEIEAGPVQDGAQEYVFRRAVGTKGGRRGRVARFAEAVAAQAEGRLSPVEVGLSAALERRSVVRASRAWNALAEHALAKAGGEDRPVRLAAPSDALPPLP
ncbi:PRTRC system protein C [Luteimonas sp. BDR2-5]|uniref:PRTRC system protein C n=1 Tax=Proluteimonas luteida TaxID=2878685 RepID=UPI001E4E12F2|nr:PRTRC system protein C [Luteimonas sp. BDR2-5]MCD9026822.1 PRTRC system protein C [Luteimonas sp. BDR2-5]